jgi:outer membrane protein TolC
MKLSIRIARLSGVTLTTAIALTVLQVQAQGRMPDLTSRSHSLSQSELTFVLKGHPMTVDEAIRVSMIASRPLGSALIAYQKARGAVNEVNSAFLPQISLGAQASEFDKANSIDLGALMGGPSLPLTIANRWNPSLVAGLTMQIDISGAVRSASRQSEFMALATRIDIDRVRNQLALDVRSNYYQVLRFHGIEQVANDNLIAAQIRLQDAKLNESVGNAPQFDVVSAERDVAEADQGVVVARTQESIAMSMLKNVMGVDQAAQFSIPFEGALSSLSVPSTGATTNSLELTKEIKSGAELEAMVSDALRFRPEVLESQAAIEASRHGVRYARRSMLPSLSAGLGYNYQPNNGAFTLQRSAVASVSLSIPLFDGGLAKAKVKQAEADRAEAESNYRGAVDQVKMEVQNASVNLYQARARIVMADAGLRQAKVAYRLAQERYSIGVSKSSVVSPQLEVSSAVAALTLAKTNWVNAFIDFSLAQATLEHAEGKFARPIAAK